jgi:hypothetical protein
MLAHRGNGRNGLHRTPPWVFAAMITCCSAKTQYCDATAVRRLEFGSRLLPFGKNMQKTHGSHAGIPLTKSIRLIYLFSIGGREI